MLFVSLAIFGFDALDVQFKFQIAEEMAKERKIFQLQLCMVGRLYTSMVLLTER